MCDHFRVITSKGKCQVHFGKNFKQKHEYYTEFPTAFMYFNETLHSLEQLATALSFWVLDQRVTGSNPGSRRVCSPGQNTLLQISLDQ